MLLYIWNVGFDILLIFVFYYLNKTHSKSFYDKWRRRKQQLVTYFLKSAWYDPPCTEKMLISSMESRQLELYEGFCSTYFLELTKFSNL